ncbi:MAG TPA: GNAT family N-acetyltransferase [Firmicutes bacterium]|nr:GNAT family N-acetyltransferase [Bacillota bacterium]
MIFTFEKMRLTHALDIIAWEYPPPYEAYNLQGSALALAKLTEGSYVSVFWEGKLAGFFCYGSAARLKTTLDHKLYDDENYLDVGLGLRPRFCGRGWGAKFVTAGLKHAQDLFWQGGFRLTVAANNVRALKVYEKVGFQKTGQFFWNSRLAPNFIVLTLENHGLAEQGSPFD